MKTVSKELAKKMKDLGFEQVADKWWLDISLEYGVPHLSNRPDENSDNGWISYAAPSAEEIIDKMPWQIELDDGSRFDLDIWKDEESYIIAYFWSEESNIKGDFGIEGTKDECLAEAAGEMWIYLKTNGLLDQSKKYGGKRYN